jgi:hypothetical protein
VLFDFFSKDLRSRIEILPRRAAMSPPFQALRGDRYAGAVAAKHEAEKLLRGGS